MSNRKNPSTEPVSMAPEDRPVFQIADALPMGMTTMLEASAGTGKTFALAALTVRFVAEQDISISQVLLVTFTRAATAELKDRIRVRLAESAEYLARCLLGQNDTDDPLLEHLGNCENDQIAIRLERLERAVADYDTAQIHTIHGFCAQVRESLGILADLNTDSVPTGDEASLVQQVCADLLFIEASKRAASSEVDSAEDAPAELPELGDLMKDVRKARQLGECVITAESGQAKDVLRRDLIELALQELARRLAQTGQVSFDSLLLIVRDALRADSQLVKDLQAKFKVALIDEFQDTDPVQWEIFNTAFGSGPRTAGASVTPTAHPCTLVLVGDPKQAIYSFRGGDVYTYLAAARDAKVQRLGTNQRSDEAAVSAMNALAKDQFFGEPEIEYQQVESSPRHAGRKLVSSEVGQSPAETEPLPGLVLRCIVNAETSGLRDSQSGKLAADPVRERIAADLASVAAELLAEGVIEQDGSSRKLNPGDIAVLVGGKAGAPQIAEALKELGIPAILRMGDNVAGSEAADQWRTLFHALDRPAATNRATAASFTWFFGWSAEQVAEALAASDQDSQAASDLANLQRTLMDWAELMQSKGMAALFGAVRAHSDDSRVHKTLLARVLSADSGERNLTDLEHIAELIHAEARQRGRGLSASSALAILDGLSGTGSDEVAIEAAQRRVESEADAVQILTIHASKGLEFPVVLLPDLWSGGKRVQAGDELSYFSKDANCRVLDVSTERERSEGVPARTREKMAPRAYSESVRQNCGDQHRLTYVALTRAVHQSVVWWAPMDASGAFKTGLARMLFNNDPELGAGAKVDVGLTAPLELLAARFADSIASDVIELVEVQAPDASQSGVGSQGDDEVAVDGSSLGAATIDRELDRETFRWSYSSLQKKISSSKNADVEGDPTDSRSEDSRAQDELLVSPSSDSDKLADLAAAALTDQQAEAQGWSNPSPYLGLGGGIPFGNLVHELFENLDFAAENLEEEIKQELLKLTYHRVTEEQLEKLPQVLAETMRTPFGPQFGGLSLNTLEASDHLDELDFNLALAQQQPVSASQIGKVIRKHLDSDDPFAKWADRLATGLGHIKLQGYLSGSIDLTLRYTVDGQQKYSVVDYKTNQLSPRDQVGSLLDYHPAKLPKVMTHTHYALQALLYSVALHRYLRWRLPDYRPELHLGPVGYLFVRGMVGADTPVVRGGPHDGVRAGVFCWQPPVELIEELSTLLAGGQTQAVAS